MVKLALNKNKFNNYAFFCPVSKLHLTISNPVGYSNEVTPTILRAIKVNTLIDVDSVIDIETGTVKDVQSTNTSIQKTSKNPEKTNNVDTKNNNSSEQSEKVAEQPTEEANKAKKSRTKTKEATDVNEKTE